MLARTEAINNDYRNQSRPSPAHSPGVAGPGCDPLPCLEAPKKNKPPHQSEVRQRVGGTPGLTENTRTECPQSFIPSGYLVENTCSVRVMPLNESCARAQKKKTPKIGHKKASPDARGGTGPLSWWYHLFLFTRRSGWQNCSRNVYCPRPPSHMRLSRRGAWTRLTALYPSQ